MPCNQPRPCPFCMRVLSRHLCLFPVLHFPSSSGALPPPSLPLSPPFCPHMLTLTNNAANELPTLSFNPNSSVALGIIERANNGWTANIERRKEGRKGGGSAIAIPGGNWQRPSRRRCPRCSRGRDSRPACRGRASLSLTSLTEEDALPVECRRPGGREGVGGDRDADADRGSLTRCPLTGRA